MRRVILMTVAWVLGMAIAGQWVWAEPPGREAAPQVPIAGPAPADEGLPPLPDEVRQKAALQMMIVVVVALALIVWLLHVFGMRIEVAPPPATPEQELAERVDRALRERDSGSGGDDAESP